MKMKKESQVLKARKIYRKEGLESKDQTKNANARSSDIEREKKRAKLKNTKEELQKGTN
jgi:hypothetical protein